MTISATVLATGLLTVFLASAVYSLTGFGFALVAAPILVAVLPPTSVVPIMLVLVSVLTFGILLPVKRYVDLQRIWPLMVAGVLGMPLGALLLLALDAQLLKVLMGVVVAGFALAQLSGLRLRVTHEKVAWVPVGFLSGLLVGSTSMSGPPVVLFFANQAVERQIFRANLLAYFMVLNLASLPVFGATGLLSGATLTYALSFLPALGLGAWFGHTLSYRVDDRLFRRLVLCIVLVAGLLSVVAGLRGG